MLFQGHSLPCKSSNNNTSICIPFSYPREPPGNTIKAFASTKEDTALDLSKPEGTATNCPLSYETVARTKRVNGFAFVKSAPKTADSLRKCGCLLLNAVRIIGRTKSSNPTKQAEGLPESPNKTFSPRAATVVTLPAALRLY